MRLSRLSKIVYSIILLLILAAGLFLILATKESRVEGNFLNVKLPTSNFESSSVAQLPLINQAELPLKFLFFGDIMLDRDIKNKIKNQGFDYLLKGLASANFFEFDLVGANLEGAVTNSGNHYDPISSNDFAFTPASVNELKKYNFSYFTIANNHLSDQGNIGVKETRDNLNALGFNFSGDIDAVVSDASRENIILKNKAIAFISLSMVYHDFDLAKAEEIIRAARSESDWVFVNIHWGNEYQHNFNVRQQEIGRALIDAGADIIIGHHPHVVQGVEIYKNRPIFYSLGNFIFDQYFSVDTQQGLSLDLTLSDQGMQIKLLPLVSSRGASTLMSNDKLENFLNDFSTWSQADSELTAQIKAQTINIAK